MELKTKEEKRKTKAQRCENVQKTNSTEKREWKSTVALIVAILSLVLSAFVYFDNKTTQGEDRQEDQLRNLLSARAPQQITTNIEFWDHTTNLLIQDLCSDYDLYQPFIDIIHIIDNKQSMIAADQLDGIGAPLNTDGRFILLKCCMLLRSDIAAYNADLCRIDRYPDISAMRSEICMTDLDEHMYRTALGIIDYLLGDIVNATNNLQSAIATYDIDSANYDVTNYWLALLAINTRVCLCDIPAFLNSTFHDNPYTHIVKSTIAFLFGEKDYNMCAIVYRDKNGGVQAESKYITALCGNPAEYLESNDVTPLTCGYSQKELHRLYSMVFEYSNYIQNVGLIEIYDNKPSQEISKALEGILSENGLNTLYDPIAFCAKPPYVKMEPDSAWYPACHDLCKMHYDSIIPIDAIFELVISISIHNYCDEQNWWPLEKGRFSRAVLIKNCLYDLSKNYQDADYDQNPAANAALALYYSEGRDDIGFDKYDAALFAYRGGYRLGFIYDALLEYYSQEQKENEIMMLKDEMDVLGFLYNRE